MKVGKYFGIFAPWGDGIGTLGIMLGRFYADIFWSNWPMATVDDAGVVELYDASWRDYIPSGLYVRLPWCIFRGNVIGGRAFRIYFRRPWRIRFARQ